MQADDDFFQHKIQKYHRPGPKEKKRTNRRHKSEVIGESENTITLRIKGKKKDVKDESLNSELSSNTCRSRT